jgi:hypothetical protein
MWPSDKLNPVSSSGRSDKIKLASSFPTHLFCEKFQGPAPDRIDYASDTRVTRLPADMAILQRSGRVNDEDD